MSLTSPSDVYAGKSTTRFRSSSSTPSAAWAMSSKPADPTDTTVASRWAMSSWLTAYYTLSVFILLAAASALLYWGLQRNLLQQDEDFLAHKVQVLTVLLERRPLDRNGVDQEVLEEAEISGQSPASFFLRVLDATGHVIDETPGMDTVLPVSAFPQAHTQAGSSPSRQW